MEIAAKPTALLLGATASLAYPLAHELATRGYDLILCGRDEEELELLAGDLEVRHGLHATTLHADFTDPRFSPESFLREAPAFDTLIWLAGDMGEENFTTLPHTLALNFTLPAQLLFLTAERMAGLKRAQLVVISSVAGDRGRASNFIYGSAKAGLTAFASGLRNRYAKSGPHVLTVKPGFIDTPLTWPRKSPLTAKRERVAHDIARAMQKRRDVLYTPWFWRWIMLVICYIPERVFKRLKL